MKILIWIGRIAFVAVAAAALLLTLGTLFVAIPVVGSIGGYITLGAYPVFIPAVLAATLAALILFVFRRKIVYLATTLMLVGALAAVCVALGSVYGTLREAGADVRLLKTYATRNVADVAVDTVLYQSDGELAMDVYHYADGKTDKPLVVYVHGGGWIGGDKTDHAYYSKVFAREGYVAVSVAYTLSDDGHHMVGTVEKQLSAALAYVKTHAHLWGADPDKLYMTGDSAGGNLALEMAYKINGGVYDQHEGVTLPRVKAVAVTYPVADPALFWQNDDLILGKTAKKMCEQYTGTTPQQNAALYAAITPANFLLADTPPTLILVGEHDTMVQPQGAYDLADALSGAERSHKLVRIPYLNHSFDSFDGSIMSQAVLSLSLDWFAQNE